MTHSALITLAVALGLRHGVDPDHLAVIDGLSRLRPSRWNGVLFALGHGLIVTLLAVGVGGLLARIIGPYTPWLLVLLGGINLWRLLRPVPHHHHHGFERFARTSPLLLGIVFGAGFETASQLSALVLAADINPWILGIMFSVGMVLVDGTDGYLAYRTQRQAIAGGRRALLASRALGIFVVVFSFGLGGAELLNLDIDRVALPLGCALFVYLVALRIWSAREPAEGSLPNSAAATEPNTL
jgi:nickel/cobalt transporter (NiCoT) family protein